MACKNPEIFSSEEEAYASEKVFLREPPTYWGGLVDLLKGYVAGFLVLPAIPMYLSQRRKREERRAELESDYRMDTWSCDRLSLLMEIARVESHYSGEERERRLRELRAQEESVSQKLKCLWDAKQEIEKI